MNRFILSSICAGVLLWCTSCGSKSESTTTKQQQDSLIASKLLQSSENAQTNQTDENSIANKVFSLNKNREACNAQALSKEWSTMKFNPDGTVSSISAIAKNTGGSDFFELRQTSFGSYSRKDDIVTIEFTKMKSEKIQEGKTTDSSMQDLQATWVLKITKCNDKRMQLVSNLPNKNAKGAPIKGKDLSCWMAM